MTTRRWAARVTILKKGVYMNEQKNTTSEVEVQAEKKDVAIATPTPQALTAEAESKEFNNLYKMATIMAGSRLVPKDYFGKRDDVFVAIMMGREIGIAPMQAMQNIAVINGRPCIWGDAALALVKASGFLEYIIETPATKEKPYATCTVKRKGEPNEVSRTFSWAQAERAGLPARGGVWKTYPERMMQMRARAFALRDVFPDVLKGIGIADETLEMPNKEPVKDMMPKRIETPANDFEPALMHEGAAQVDTPPETDDRVITEPQLKRLYAIAKEAGYTSEEVKTFLCAEYSIEHLTELKRSDYNAAIAMIEGKGNEAANAK